MRFCVTARQLSPAVAGQRRRSSHARTVPTDAQQFSKGRRVRHHRAIAHGGHQQLDVQVKNWRPRSRLVRVYAAEAGPVGPLGVLDVRRRRVSRHRHRVVWIRPGKRRYPYARSRSKDAAHGRSDPTRRCPAPAGVRSILATAPARRHPWRSHDSCAARGRCTLDIHYGQCAALAVKLKTPLLQAAGAAEASSRRANLTLHDGRADSAMSSARLDHGAAVARTNTDTRPRW